MRFTIRQQICECINELEKGQIALEEKRDIWQNDLIWWMCKALCLLLVEELKRRSRDEVE